MRNYKKSSLSNGNVDEQALIRRWWYEEKNAQGALVWEYHLEGRYLDAVYFPDSELNEVEDYGPGVTQRHPLGGQRVVLCESKLALSPELIGQALVYRQLALHAGANIDASLIFAKSGDAAMLRVAEELGLEAIL